MVRKSDYITAFTHTQHGIEKILWDKIVSVFQGLTSSEVRGRIDRVGSEKQSHIMTHELITWAFIVGGITDDEYRDLLEFNGNRNKIVHGHGNWWFGKNYKGALGKGIRFLEANGM